MANYFSKYKGRGGPAIEPGIIQMMGSIGDEYAKGITALGESIGKGLEEKAKRKQAEADLDAIKKFYDNSETVTDDERFERDKKIEAKALDIKKQERDSAHTAFKTDQADFEDFNVLSGHEDILKDKAFLQGALDELVSDNEKEEGILEVRENQLEATEGSKIGGLQLPKFDSRYPFGIATPFTPNRPPMGLLKAADYALVERPDQLKIIKEKRKTVTRNRENISAFQEQIAKLATLSRMEMENPGSTKGRASYTWNPDEKLTVHETEKSKLIEERLLFYRGLEEEQGILKTRQTPDGQTVGISRGTSMEMGRGALLDRSGYTPRRKKLAQSILEKVTDSTQINRLLNYGKQPLKRQTEESLERYATTQRVYDEALENRISAKDYIRRLTQEEKMTKLVNNVNAGVNSPSIVDKIMEMGRAIEKPTFHVVTDPTTGEKRVVLSNKYHAVKPVSTLGSPEHFAQTKYLQGRTTAAIQGWNTLEDDRTKAVATLEKELLDLQTKKEVEGIEEPEIKRMKNLPALIRAAKLTYETRFRRHMSNYPLVYKDMGMQTGVME
jgi:hypothetical protein